MLENLQACFTTDTAVYNVFILLQISLKNQSNHLKDVRKYNKLSAKIN